MNPAEFDKALKDFALALFHEDEEKHEEWVAVLRRLEQVGRSARQGYKRSRRSGLLGGRATGRGETEEQGV